MKGVNQMPTERCDNYDTCKKYAIYGKCERECNQFPSLDSFCDVHEKQIINILSSIDEKLELLLGTKQDT